jgi:hypothetical protein
MDNKELWMVGQKTAINWDIVGIFETEEQAKQVAESDRDHARWWRKYELNKDYGIQ